MISHLHTIRQRSEHHAKNLYDFVKFLNTVKVNDNEWMISFDVVLWFTKIQVDLAMKIARKRLETYPCEDLLEVINWLVKKFCRGIIIC